MIIPPMIEQFEKLGQLATDYIHKSAHITSIPAAVTQWAASHPVREAAWRLPTVSDLNFINDKPNRAFDVIASSGGERVKHDFYWTANEYLTKEQVKSEATGIYFLFVNNKIENGNKTHRFGVRAILAF